MSRIGSRTIRIGCSISRIKCGMSRIGCRLIVCIFCSKSTTNPLSAEETYTSASKKVTLRAKKNNSINTNFFSGLCG